MHKKWDNVFGIHTVREYLFLFTSGRYDAVLQQFNDSVKMCQEQKALITQLEDDLRKVNALSVMFRGDAEVRLIWTKAYLLAL